MAKTNTPLVVKKESKVVDVPLVVDEPKIMETEKEFLKHLLLVQHTGGFGHHLDDIINGRIKLLS